MYFVGRDSSVSIVTRYGLDGPGFESRWRARFSAPVQTDPAAQPASYTIGTGSFPGVMRPGRGVDHPPPSITGVKERVELYLYLPPPLPRAFVAYSRVNCTYTFTMYFGRSVRPLSGTTQTCCRVVNKWTRDVQLLSEFKSPLVHQHNGMMLPKFWTHYAVPYIRVIHKRRKLLFVQESSVKAIYNTLCVHCVNQRNV